MKAKINSILPGAIVSVHKDKKKRLYDVLSVIHNNQDLFILTPREDKDEIIIRSFDELHLEAILYSKIFIDANCNEVSYEEICRRSELK